MTKDFSFFERTLHERRAYRCHGERAAWRFGWMRQWGLDELVTGGRTEGEDADFTFAGTHQMRPGNPLGLARMNERFNVTLPPDMDAFYRRWDGGTLLFREIYPLLSIEQMLAVNERYLGFSDWDRNQPWPLIRFCDMGNTDYLSMRLAPDGKWQVIFMSMEYPDRDFIENWEAEHQGALLDDSFVLWLQRMINTDGWPVGFKAYYSSDIVSPTQRLVP